MNILFITHNHLGDSLISTAVIRDLKQQYPDYKVNVEMNSMEFWNDNPYLDRSVNRTNAKMVVKLFYSGSQVYGNRGSLISGFIDSMNQQLGTKVKMSENRIDLHARVMKKVDNDPSALVNEIKKSVGTYWILNAGYSDSAQVKAWDYKKYQEVVNSAKVKFVQVGSSRDHHPNLEGVIDARNCSIPEFVELMYFAKGVITPPSAAGHLASMQTPDGSPRRGIILCGNREPSERLFGYDNFKYAISNRCNNPFGCMKFDVSGEFKKCIHPVNLGNQMIAKCMDDITVEQVLNFMQD
jgi:ADP-heptose:LPS heptosyltransferase